MGVIFLLIGAGVRKQHIQVHPNWGFAPHQKINQLAVYTLPYDMLPFYKSHINYLASHAVDPDRRRYSSPYEAIRHYIDMDYWEGKDIPPPKHWNTFARSHYVLIRVHEGDTTEKVSTQQVVGGRDTSQMTRYLDTLAMNMYWHLPEWIPLDTFIGKDSAWPPGHYFMKMEGVHHGIVPWHVQRIYSSLVRSFERHEWAKVIRLSSDLGHYVADAHVPLHTTSNYNGQQTDQIGIHAFWETRIPEVLGASFNLYAGKADYVEDVASWIWKVVHTSYEMVDTVLTKEREVAGDLPSALQYSYVERNGRWERKESTKFSIQYEMAIHKMVERRMRQTIKDVGSIWMTAWVDAGQPDLPGKPILVDTYASGYQDTLEYQIDHSSCHPD